jgi:phosphate transport system substrate-binding protein
MRAVTFALTLTFIAGGIACTGGAGGEVRLQGAGATFPYPLYQKWISEYGKQNPTMKIDYQSIGSGGA